MMVMTMFTSLSPEKAVIHSGWEPSSTPDFFWAVPLDKLAKILILSFIHIEIFMVKLDKVLEKLAKFLSYTEDTD